MLSEWILSIRATCRYLGVWIRTGRLDTIGRPAMFRRILRGGLRPGRTRSTHWSITGDADCSDKFGILVTRTLCRRVPATVWRTSVRHITRTFQVAACPLPKVHRRPFNPLGQSTSIGGDHLVADPRHAGHTLGEREQSLVFSGRPDEPPDVHDTAADGNIAAAKIGPGLLAQPRLQL
jgi:hypothetical protein